MSVTGKLSALNQPFTHSDIHPPVCSEHCSPITHLISPQASSHPLRASMGHCYHIQQQLSIPVSHCYSRMLNLIFILNGEKGGGLFTESEFHYSHGKSASSRSWNGLLPFPIHFVKILLSFQTASITSNWILNYNVNFTKLLVLFISLVRFYGTAIFFALPQTSTP